MREEPPAPKKRRRHVARQWHRWLGLIVALPLLWLALSGLLLNHAQRLGLNDKTISSTWVLRHYRQIPEGQPAGIPVGDRVVAEWGGLIFLDDELLHLEGQLIGATAFSNRIAIATSEKLIVIDGSGQVSDELDELSLPGTPLEQIGTADGKLHVQVSQQWYFFNDDLLEFQKTDFPGDIPSIAELSESQVEQLRLSLSQEGAIPLSRVILDAHSGKLFGWPGWLITDLSAVSVIILTLLGLRLFPKRRS